MVAVLLLAGCTHLSRERVITIAKQAAEDDGRALSDFTLGVVHYGEHRTWWVYFDDKMSRTGEDFSVQVNDRTEEATVNWGR